MDFQRTSHRLEWKPIDPKWYVDPRHDCKLVVDQSYREKGNTKPTKRMFRHIKAKHNRELTFSQWANLAA